MSALTVAMLLLLQVVVLVATVYNLIGDLRGWPWSADAEGGALGALVIARIVLALIVIPLALAIMVGTYKGANRVRDFLQLDHDGFFYMRAGKSRFWSWDTLPAFKPAYSYRQIQFVLPGPGTIAGKPDPWIHEMTPDGPVVAISDIYDTPFDQIADTLNSYRDEALSTARATTAG